MSDTSLHSVRAPEKRQTHRSVNEIMAGWPRARFRFCFDSKTTLALLLITVFLAVALVLTAVLLIGGRDVYFDILADFDFFVALFLCFFPCLLIITIFVF